MSVESFVLTSAQVVAAVEQLEGVRLPVRTLSEWAATGLVVPSVQYHAKRGSTHPRLYSLADLARTRLVVRLRKSMSLPRVRVAVAYCEERLNDVFAASSKRSTLHMVVAAGGRAFLAGPEADEELVTGQFMLKLADVQSGLKAAAIAARKVA